jgi:Flp pilus assembly pilin Flp
MSPYGTKVLFEVTRVLLGREVDSRYSYKYTTANNCPEQRFSALRRVVDWGQTVIKAIYQLWTDESGQDVAEYAVMLAVILVIVIGTVRLIGGNANNVFSQVSSSITQ